MSIKNVLWVVPKYTFPISDGARVASNSLIQSFNKIGHNLDVLSLVDNHEDITDEYLENWGARNVYLVSRAAPKKILNKVIYWGKKFLVHPFSALTLSYFSDKSVVNNVNSRIDLSQYDTIIFDGLHGFASLEKTIKKFKGSVIYRAHNVEQDLWSTAADKSNNFFLSIFYKFQGSLMAKFENNLIKQSYITWTISDEDQTRFKEEVPSANYLTVPVGMNFSKFKKRKERESSLQLFFLGRLDWAPNRDGLRWFLENVWPVLSEKRKDIVLNIGGSGNGEWLKPFLVNKKINFHGLVDDLDLMYEKMDLAVMPIFFGSGTRIKVIESVCHGLPMISTRMGVQGSSLECDHFYHAETSEEWISILEKMNREDLEEMSFRAWTHLKNKMDYSSISDLISKTL